MADAAQSARGNPCAMSNSEPPKIDGKSLIFQYHREFKGSDSMISDIEMIFNVEAMNLRNRWAESDHMLAHVLVNVGSKTFPYRALCPGC